MGRILPKYVLNRVIIHFEAGETVPVVHKATKVAKSCLYKCDRISVTGLGRTLWRRIVAYMC